MLTQTDETLDSHPTEVACLSLVFPERPKELVMACEEECSDITTNTGDVDEVESGDGGEDVEDVDRLDQVSHAQTAPIAKKRKQDTAFQEWLEKNQLETTTASTADLDRHLAKVSASRLLQDDVKTKIIASPREYQVDLYERAKSENTIVVLDTGSGKTLIAALLLRHVLELELENRADGHEPKTAFFLVEKVALCFQQHAVLTTNLEFPIAKFFGDMMDINRSQEFWDQQFKDNMAIVCTAQILLDLLNCGFISMRQINLLVFDEAHHAKKNHPYARIIKEHYLRERDSRPRILGMTASPVDALTKDIKYAAAELENMLCSKIATISDEAMMECQLRRQQTEVKEYYHRLEDPENSRTRLWGVISRHIRGNYQFKGHLEFASNASSTLGTWCADRYWHLLVTNIEMIKIEARTGRDSLELDGAAGDAAMEAIGRVRKTIQDHCWGPISKDSPELSSKVRTLYEVLQDAFCKRQAKRCIVFVQARSTAFLLADLFQQPEMHIQGMKVAYMIGSNNSSASAAFMSYKDQITSLQKFRCGETNCIFATSVAEEGIDVPECDVIVRFDIYSSAIQYIQSKGRARQKSSLYVTMMEEGNMEHICKLRRAARDSHALRQFYASLPEDRKVSDFVVNPAILARQELASQKIYTIAETGARLTAITSLEVLAKFASSFPSSHYESGQQLEYIVSSVGRRYVSRVVLPEASPIKTVIGEVQQSKQLARCSAAFAACVQLIEKQYIDGHLQPAFAKKLPEMRNARLALASDKKSEHEMRIKPDFWSSCLDQEPPTALYRTTIALDRSAALGKPSRPLILMTRKPLPDVPSAPLFFRSGQVSMVRLLNSQTSLEMLPQQVEALAGFTLRLFAHVFSKDFDAKLHEIPYFIAPSSTSLSRDNDAEIDWELVQYVHENERLQWEGVPDDFFKDKFAIDPWDGSRKFILKGINEELKPSDPTPKGVPQPKTIAYKKVKQTIKEYSNSLSIASRKRRTWRDDQPVLNAELLSIRRNFLDEFYVDNEVNGACYVIPEPIIISAIPIDVVAMALIVPAVMYRVDSVLIALEACSLVGLSIPSNLALEAVTKDSFNTEEQGEDQIDFQPGMGRNYERLEFLGDTFLKMATSIAVCTRFPGADEFQSHVTRMVMLCNKNLFKHASERNMPAYIRTRGFDRRTWYPNNMMLKKGKAARTEAKHCLSHKSIADVCEALIGAAYMSGTVDNMDMAVKAVSVMVNSENHTMSKFTDYFAAYSVPKWHGQQTTAVQRLAVDKIAEITGYRFQCAPLLRNAFKHPSYVFESNIPDYQRLEFLGDALLDMAVVDFLFKRFPEADPKWLTEHKMAMVSNQFLGCLCVKLGLHKHILVATSVMLGDIKEYADQLEQAEELSRKKNSQETAAGNSSSTDAQGVAQNFWIDIQQSPKVLADVVEALVGAMFVDSEYSFSVVVSFFTKFVQPFFENIGLETSYSLNHPINATVHKLHIDFGCNQWKFHMASVPAPLETGVAVLAESDVLCALMVHDKVVAHATSSKNGHHAKVAVAKLALEKLTAIQDADLFRAEMGCDCGGGGSSAAASK